MAMRWKSRKYSTSFSSSSLCNFSGDRHLLGMAMVKNNSTSPVSVNEEYFKTLRTKSFLDMWSKVHDHRLRQVSSMPTVSGDKDDDKNNEDDGGNQKGLICGSSPLVSYGRLPDFVLEPSQETVLVATTAGDDRADGGGGQLKLQVKSLLVEYFDVTLRACSACANLLAAIGRARLRHRLLRHFLIKLSSGAGDATFDHVATLVNLENSLHPRNLVQFYAVQSDYGQLTQKLTRVHRRILRRARLHRVARWAASVTAVVACCIATAIAVAIAAHTAVCIGPVAVAAPAAVVSGDVRRAGARRWLKSLAAQVDAAARGAYIVGRDLETMSRMVRRAHDEVEHVLGVAGMAARGREEPQMASEAAREVERGAEGMADQLNELEEHVNLCLITINRSRKMVAEELMAAVRQSPGRRRDGTIA